MLTVYILSRDRNSIATTKSQLAVNDHVELCQALTQIYGQSDSERLIIEVLVENLPPPTETENPDNILILPRKH